MRRSTKILLTMCIVTFRPFMFFINIRTKTCFVWIDHKFFNTHLFFMLIQILGKFSVGHQISYRATFFSTKRQWINSFIQIKSIKRMKFVRRRQISINNYQRSIEICGAVNLELIGVSISRKPISIALQKQNMQAYLFPLWLIYLTFLFERNFLSKYTKQRLFILLDIGTVNWFPQRVFRLKDVFQTWVL